MYVIYPAEDLINLLLSREYSTTPSSSTRTTPTTPGPPSSSSSGQTTGQSVWTTTSRHSRHVSISDSISTSTSSTTITTTTSDSTVPPPPPTSASEISTQNNNTNNNNNNSLNRRFSFKLAPPPTPPPSSRSRSKSTQPCSTSLKKRLEEAGKSPPNLPPIVPPPPPINFGNNNNLKDSGLQQQQPPKNPPNTPASPFLRRVSSFKNPFRREKVYPTATATSALSAASIVGGNPLPTPPAPVTSSSLGLGKGKNARSTSIIQQQQQYSLTNNNNSQQQQQQPVPVTRPARGGRAATPSITVTPTAAFVEDETFVNYRGQNFTGGTGRRLKLISATSPSSASTSAAASAAVAAAAGSSGGGQNPNIDSENNKDKKYRSLSPSLSPTRTLSNFEQDFSSLQPAQVVQTPNTGSPKSNFSFAFGSILHHYSGGGGNSNNSANNNINNNINTISAVAQSGGSGGSKMMAGSILGGGASGSSALQVGGNYVNDATSLKDLLHPSLNETLKSHNALTFKLIRIVSDFTQQLSVLHENHAVELQLLVDNFRKRNAELRKERPPCSSSLFQVWETLLQEVEIDSQAHSDLSGSLGRQVARPLLEKTFCRKIQSRKIFTHRESFETVLNKTEALLASTYRDYCDACIAHIQQGNQTTLAGYLDAHNAYVQQLRGTNAMLKEYHTDTLPTLLQELDEIYIDLCNTLSESILHGAELISSRTQETNRRYETLSTVCRNVSGNQDLRDLVKSMAIPAVPNQRHAFTPPSTDDIALADKSHVPILKEEIILDRLSAPAARNRQEALKKETVGLELEMKQLQDSLDTLIRMQQRSLDSNLFNKANELQEEISMKRFDLRVAQMHLAALRAQTRPETWNSGMNNNKDVSDLNQPQMQLQGGSGSSAAMASQSHKEREKEEKYLRDRKMSVSSTNATMKSKWMKAFRSLKTPQGSSSSAQANSASSPSQGGAGSTFATSVPVKAELDKKNGKDKDKQQGEAFQIFENHIFQEYTYKKITPCDICSQVLRGHTKQGLRCRLCKLNVHLDCQEKVSKCLPKTRLLRRQRSTSELETRLNQMANEDTSNTINDAAASSSTAATGASTSTSSKYGGDRGGSTSAGESGGGGGGGRSDEPDLIYQVLKQATDMKKPGGSSGSGSGNGIHGSSQTLYSQHELGMGGMGGSSTSGARRSNPSVNVVGNLAPNSGSSTPGGAMGAAQAIAQSSSSGRRGSELRRDSYISHKSISADPGSGSTAQIYLEPPTRPRCISLPETPKTPHSPRRRKLDLRMKSFSLDSPESTEHAQRRRYKDHGSHSTSHSQYWRPPSCYPNSMEDNFCGSHEGILKNHYGHHHQHHHHGHRHIDDDLDLDDLDLENDADAAEAEYNYGMMVHSSSAANNVMLQSSNSNSSCNSVSLKRTFTPPSSLNTAPPHSSFYSRSELQSPSFASLNHFAPSSPVHNRRALLSARNVRMSSVELPDENDATQSSASTSPCPSPKPHRLLPTNLYVVLYMFKARHPDELDLKAGYKVTVTDTTDPDWWLGKNLGRMGYFPSKYVTKLQPGEKPLQVTHNLQVTDGAENGLKLLRDQIVIQVGEELDGMVTIRNGENKQGICPLKYLQEV